MYGRYRQRVIQYLKARDLYSLLPVEGYYRLN
jgi:hypothetical protein